MIHENSSCGLLLTILCGAQVHGIGDEFIDGVEAVPIVYEKCGDMKKQDIACLLLPKTK